MKVAYLFTAAISLFLCALLVVPDMAASSPFQPSEREFQDALGAFMVGKDLAALAGLEDVITSAKPGPWTHRARFLLAQYYRCEGRFEDVFRVLRPLEAQAYPLHIETLLLLQEAAQKTEDFQQADRLLTELYTIDPGRSELAPRRYTLGASLMGKDDPQGLIVFQILRERYPDSPKVAASWLAEAQYHERKQDLPACEKALREVVRRVPHWGDVKGLGERLLKAHRDGNTSFTLAPPADLLQAAEVSADHGKWRLMEWYLKLLPAQGLTADQRQLKSFLEQWRLYREKKSSTALQALQDFATKGKPEVQERLSATFINLALDAKNYELALAGAQSYFKRFPKGRKALTVLGWACQAAWETSDSMMPFASALAQEFPATAPAKRWIMDAVIQRILDRDFENARRLISLHRLNHPAIPSEEADRYLFWDAEIARRSQGTAPENLLLQTSYSFYNTTAHLLGVGPTEDWRRAQQEISAPDRQPAAPPDPETWTLLRSRLDEWKALHFWTEAANEALAIWNLGADTPELWKEVVDLCAKSGQLRKGRKLLWAALESGEKGKYPLSNRQVLEQLFPLDYEPLILVQAAQEGLDPLFVASIILQESAFEHDAVSPSNARGLMQIIPTTATWMAKKMKERKPRKEDLFHPPLNLRLGVRYLSWLVSKFEGNLMLATAAYNAGPSRVNKWQVTGPADDLLAFMEWIPYKETRTYVRLVLRNYMVYRWLYGETAVERPPALFLEGRQLNREEVPKTIHAKNAAEEGKQDEKRLVQDALQPESNL